MLFAPLALCALAPSAARADFYALDGRFECLNQPRAVCYDATPSRAAAPRNATKPEAAAREPRTESAPTIKPTSTMQAAPQHIDPPSDPVLAIAARVREKRPAEGDVAALHRAAVAGDARAIELLAWCALRGIGTARNPVAAYFLYGEAAAASVPHARANQAAVYMQSLTSEERQRVLDIEAMPPSRRMQGLLSAADPAG